MVVDALDKATVCVAIRKKWSRDDWNDVFTLCLVDCCVEMRVCKQDWDVLDSRVFLRIT